MHGMKERLANHPHFRGHTLAEVETWARRRFGPQRRNAQREEAIDYRVNSCRWSDVTLAWIGISVPMAVEVDAYTAGYLIQMPDRGAQSFRIGGQELTATPDRAVIISPTSPGPILHRSPPGSRLVLQLGDRIVRATMRDLSLRPARGDLPTLPMTLDLRVGPGRMLRDLVMTLADEIERQDSRLVTFEHVLEYLSRAIVALLFDPSQANQRIETERLAIVVRHIADHLDQPLSLDELARVGQLSKRTLQRTFSRRYEISPIEYVRRQRLERARQLLLSGSPDMTVTRVALQTGFTHMGRFAREYRAHFGERPSVTLGRESRLAIRGPV